MAAEAESSKKGEEFKTIVNEESKNVPTAAAAAAAAAEELKKLTITEEQSKIITPTMTKGKEKEEETKVKLKTSDDVTFEVEAWIAKEMETVQTFIDDTDAATADADTDAFIPLHNVEGRELGRIVEYCTEHRRLAGAGNVKALKEFEERFTAALNLDEMKELVLAANYLNMKNFLDFVASGIADAIKDKSVEFVREYFGIANDYTPDEEAEFRETNAWAFQNVNDD